ncbi:MAG: hypothetical protein ACP5M9_01065 [Candidatus Micrarchaeia archaeon]
MFIAVFSVGAIDALVPVLIIIVFIAAAGGISRGFSLFNLFGIGTLIKTGPSGKGSLSQKTMKKSYLHYGQKPLSIKKTEIKTDENKKNYRLKKDFEKNFSNNRGKAAQINVASNPKNAAIIENEGKGAENKNKGKSILPFAGKTLLNLTSPLLKGSILAGGGFINMVAKKRDYHKKNIFYKYETKTLKSGKENFSSYNNDSENTLIQEGLASTIAIRKKILEDRRRIARDKKLSDAKKKFMIANSNAANRFFLERENEFRTAQKAVDKMREEYVQKSARIQSIADSKEREAAQKELDESTFANFSKTYNKLFDTRKDYAAKELSSKLFEKGKVYGNYKYKLNLFGKGEDKEGESGYSIIEFNLDREEK